MKLALLLIALTSLPACGIFNVQGPGGGHSATTHSSSMSDARARKRQRMARQNAADRERLSRAREARNRRINARKKVERAERDVRLKRRELVAAISKDMKRFRVTLKGGAPLLPGEVAIVATRIARLRSMDAKHAGTYSRELFAMRLDSARNGDASGKGFADLVGGKLVKHEAVAWKQSPSNAMAFAMRKGRCYLGILHHPTTRTPLSNYTVDRLEMVAKKPSGHVPFTLYGSDFYIMRGTCAHRNTKAAWSYRTNNQDQRRRSWSMTIVSFERAAIPKWVRNRYAYRAPAACDVSSFTNMWRYPLAGLTGFIANQPVAYTDQGFMAITGQRISGEFAFEPSGPVRVGPPAVPPSLSRTPTRVSWPSQDRGSAASLPLNPVARSASAHPRSHPACAGS